MARTRILIVSVVLTAAFLPILANAQGGGIKPGGTFQAEIPTSAKPKTRSDQRVLVDVFGQQGNGLPYFGFVTTEVPITLKAGQNLSVNAVVSGSGRKVFLVLIDPAGKRVAKTNAIAIKTTDLSVDEVNSSGTYKIEVWSDQVGRFTLKTSGGSEEDDGNDVQQLEAKVERLAGELAAAKAQLKAAKAKSAKRRD